LPEFGIGQGPPQHPRILVELAEPGVALIAEQKAQPARGMAMIDAELGGRPSLADRTEAVLRGCHEVVVSLREAVLALELQRGFLGFFPFVTKTAGRLVPFSILRVLCVTLPLGG
jgi:hypothetical protein